MVPLSVTNSVTTGACARLNPRDPARRTVTACTLSNVYGRGRMGCVKGRKNSVVPSSTVHSTLAPVSITVTSIHSVVPIAR